MRNDEAELKAYILEILSDYVNTYLTVNHEQYTQIAAAEVTKLFFSFRPQV